MSNPKQVMDIQLDEVKNSQPPVKTNPPKNNHNQAQKRRPAAKKVATNANNPARNHSKSAGATAPKKIVRKSALSDPVQPRKIPFKHWEELFDYEFKFFAKSAVLFALKEVTEQPNEKNKLRIAYKNDSQGWSSLFDLYKTFSNKASLLIQLWIKETSTKPAHMHEHGSAIYGNENKTLNQISQIKLVAEKPLDDNAIINIINDYHRSVCKKDNVRNYLENIIAPACAEIAVKQTYLSNFLKQNDLFLGDYALNDVLEVAQCQFLKETFPQFIDDNFLYTKIKAFLTDLSILPIQYITKLELLFKEISSNTAGDNDLSVKLSEIHGRIQIVTSSVNESRRNAERGNIAHMSMVLPTKKLNPLQNLAISIAYILHTISYFIHAKAETSDEILLNALLNLKAVTIDIFINNKPAAIGVLIETLENNLPQIRNLSNVHNLLDDIKKFLEEGNLEVKNKIHTNLNVHLSNANLPTIKPIQNSDDAKFSVYLLIIEDTVTDLTKIQAMTVTKNTLPPVKGSVQIMSRLFEVLISRNNCNSSLYMIGLRIKFLIQKLENFKKFEFETLNNLISGLRVPYAKNIMNLILFEFASSAQFCDIALSYMAVEDILPLMSLLAVTESFKKTDDKTIHSKIMNGFLEHATEWTISNNNKSTEVCSGNLLVLINLINIVNKNLIRNADEKTNQSLLQINQVATKLALQILNHPIKDVRLDELNTVATQLLGCFSDNDIEPWVKPTVMGLIICDDINKLVSQKPPQQNVLVKQLSQQDAIHFLYKNIFKQCAQIFIDYIESNIKVIKSQFSATAKLRYVDYCCEQLENLYRLDLPEVQQRIAAVKSPFQQSIIGLIQFTLGLSETGILDLKNLPEDIFTASRQTSIKMLGSLTNITIPAINDLLNNLEMVIPINSNQSSNMQLQPALGK